MNENREWRTKNFFDYWRKRLDFIRKLSIPEDSHEANVLVWAAIDALANLWAKGLGKGSAPSGKREIFDAFLARYGGDPFQRVSLPDVWHRAEKGTIDSIPAEVVRVLLTVRGRRMPIFVERRQLRSADNDPDLVSLVEEVVAACPAVSRSAVENALRLSRYGSLAYKRMRNAYIHEGRSGKDTHSFRFEESSAGPTYLSGVLGTPAVIGFAPEFMTATLARCIDEFEKDATANKVDPVPAPHD
jgi:hypothetical protein